MRYTILVLIYVVLLTLHLQAPGSVEGDVQTTTYFCQEVDCATLLLTVLEYNPQAQCAFYDIGEQRILEYVQTHNHTIYLHGDAIDTELQPHVIALDRPGLMHHKFCVYGDTVMTGSWNPTMRGTYLNDNYLLFLTHPAIAQAYRDELKRMRGFKRTAPLSIQNESSRFSVYFCPVHHCEAQVLKQVQEANRSIDLLSFTFTSKPLQAALIEAKGRGVNIRFLQEKRQAHLSSIEEALAEAGAAVRFDGNSYTMHGKVWILDNTTLILGSYNPTKAGTTKNDENLVILTRYSGLVEDFNEEFDRIWQEGIIKPLA